MAFDVGAIVGELQLKKDKWDQSIKKVKSDQKSLSGLVLRNSQQFKKMGRSMTIAGGVIVGSIGLMVKAYADFDQAMTESLAIMGDISDATRKKMEGVAKAISEETTYSAKQLAEAYYFLASAGMNAAQSMGALPIVAKFAQAGAFDLATATDLLTDAQTALGLSSKDTVENQKNLIRVSDVLVGANTLANASVLQFAESLTNKAAAALVNLNKEVEEGVAVLAAYADKGVKGRLAGQRLTMMLNGLFDATRRNKKAWDDAGISLFKADGSMRSFADIIQDLEGYLGAMTVKQREAALALLGFNLKTKDSILTLMGSSEKIRTWTENLKDMKGMTDEVAEKQLEAFNNQLILLRNTLTNAAIAIGETLGPALRGLIGDVKETVGGISEWIQRHPKLTEYVTKSALAIGGLLTILGPLAMMLPGLVQGFMLLGPAIGAILGPITVIAGGLALLTTGFVVLYQTAIAEEKKWRDNTVLLGKALDSMGVSMEATRIEAGMSVKEWKKLRKEYDNNDFALARAIEKGEINVTLQEAQIKTSRKLKEEKEKQEKAEKALADITEKLNEGTSALTDSQKESIKTQKDLRKAAIEAARAHYEQSISLAELYGLTVAIPGKIKDWEKTTKKVTAIVSGSLGKIIDATGKAGDEFGFLSAKWYSYGNEIKTTSEKVADGSIKKAKEIGVAWEDVAKDMANYWSNAMAQMVKEGINFTDVINMTWQTMAVGAGSAVSKMVSEIKGLGKLAGPLGELAGSVAGTVISAIGSIFGIKSAAQKAAEEEARALEKLKHQLASITADMAKYGEITEATAEKIRKSRESMVGYLAVSKHFADVIRDVGVTQENVNQLWTRATDIIHHYTEGGLSAADATSALDESFQLLIEGAQKLGTEGSAAMIEFIQKVRESGLEVAAVTEYVIDQLNKIPAALETLITTADQTGISIEGLEARTLAAFNAMVDSGMSYTDVIKNMSPSILALRDRMNEMGITGSEAIQKLFKIAEVTEAHKALFDAIDADKQLLAALGNTGYMTADILNAFAADAVKNFKKLKNRFGDSDDALRAMGPTLQQIKDYAEAYNITLDEGTQKLIDQAIELGVVKEKQESVQEVAERGFGEMKEVLMEIRDLLQGMGKDLRGSGLFQKLKDVDAVSQTTWANMNAGVGSVINNVGNLGSKFSDTFNGAEAAAWRVGKNISKAFSSIQPRIKLNIDGMPKYAGAYQHGGVIEAGPRQPTMFMFGEGSKREVAEIRHTDKRGTGETKIKVDINFNEPVTVRSDEDLARIEEAFRRNMDGLSEKVAGHLDRFRR